MNHHAAGLLPAAALVAAPLAVAGDVDVGAVIAAQPYVPCEIPCYTVEDVLDFHLARAALLASSRPAAA